MIRTMKRVYVYITFLMMLAACTGTGKTARSDSPYKRKPIVEVTESELKNDAEQIDATMQQLLGNQEEAIAK